LKASNLEKFYHKALDTVIQIIPDLDILEKGKTGLLNREAYFILGNVEFPMYGELLLINFFFDDPHTAKYYTAQILADPEERENISMLIDGLKSIKLLQ